MLLVVFYRWRSHDASLEGGPVGGAQRAVHAAADGRRAVSMPGIQTQVVSGPGGSALPGSGLSSCACGWIRVPSCWGFKPDVTGVRRVLQMGALCLNVQAGCGEQAGVDGIHGAATHDRV